MRAPHPATLAAAIAGAFALPPGPACADEPVALRLATELSSEPTPAGAPAFARADRIGGRIGFDTTLEGDAEIRRGGVVVRGDRITYYEADDEVVAVGQVRVARPGIVATGPQLQLRLEAGVGQFERPAFSVPASGGRGVASRIDFLGPGRVLFRDMSYTTCTPERPAWFVRAQRLDMNESGGEATGSDASIEFFGATLLSTPTFWFPMGEGRSTGFLLPTARATSRSGLSLGVPFYWDIAPNRDLTLYPRLLSLRGAQLGSWFRYLEPGQRGEVRAEILPGDREAGRDRWFASATHAFADLGGWTGGWNLRGVSDDRYFVDFSTSILGASERSLPRDLFATRTVGDWTMLARATAYQNILEARAAPPYSRLPQLGARWDVRDVGGFDAASVFDLSRFERPLAGSPAGWRAVANPSIAWAMRTPGAFLVPRVGVHASSYRLDVPVSLPEGAGPVQLDRVLPTLSVDAGLVFERPWEAGGRTWRQTLEPRMFYVRTPYRDQSAFPVFDTVQADFNFAQLFSTNTFAGSDRIANVDQLTTAMVSRLLDPGTGREAMRFALGQRLYFDPQRVTIAGETPRTDTRSDLLAAASASLDRGWWLDGGLQANLSDGHMPRFNAAARWNPRPEHILNVAYRYRRDVVDQMDVSAQWPLSNRWYALGRLNWSLARLSGLEPGLIEALAGGEFREDCWAVRVMLQQFVTSALTRTTAMMLQLELSGLAKLGSDPSAILSRSIPGWRLPGDREIETSRYLGYE